MINKSFLASTGAMLAFTLSIACSPAHALEDEEIDMECVRTSLNKLAPPAAATAGRPGRTAPATRLPGVVKDPNTGKILGAVTNSGLFIPAEYAEDADSSSIPIGMIVPKRIAALCGGGGDGGFADMPVEITVPLQFDLVEITGRRAAQPAVWQEYISPGFQQVVVEAGSTSAPASPPEQTKEQKCNNRVQNCEVMADMAGVAGQIGCMNVGKDFWDVAERMPSRFRSAAKAAAAVAEAACMVGVEYAKWAAKRECQGLKEACMREP